MSDYSAMGRRSGDVRRAKAQIWKARAGVLAQKAWEIDPSMSDAAVARFIKAHWEDPLYREECILAVALVVWEQARGRA